MIILDTDIISLLDQQSGTTYELLADRVASHADERFCVTIVSVEEQMRGWLSYIAASRTMARQIEGYVRLHRMMHWYERQEVLDFDSTAAQIFSQLKGSRIKCGAMDLKIASIALQHHALLISRNLKDFRRVPNLKVEDWTVPQGDRP